MTIVRPVLLAAAVLAGAARSAGALTELMSRADVPRAIAIGNGSDLQRERFHTPYYFRLSGDTLESIEVVTEFRRFVLAVEEQRTLGNWMVAQGGTDATGHSLLQLLEPWRGRVTIRASVRFHPLNAYTTLPPLDVELDTPSLLTLDVVRTPTFAVSPDGTPTGGMVGATIDATFNAPSVGDRIVPVRVRFDGRALPPVSIDFSRFD